MALAASDYPRPRRVHAGTAVEAEIGTDDQNNNDDGGGVEGSPSSILVNYFLKSHGGAHAFQCVCSFLASSAAVASLFVSVFLTNKNPKSNLHATQLVLLKRTMIFACVKHVTGLLGASILAAKAIPEVGLSKARIWMKQLARDPISHYIFYTACILLWLSSGSTVSALDGTTQLAQIVFSAARLPWIPFVLVGPVLIRETGSSLLVILDVLILCSTSRSKSTASSDSHSQSTQKLLRMTQRAIDMAMSLLVTPRRWRSADAASRQQGLAKFSSKLSLVLEVVVGFVMVFDAIGRLIQFVFGTSFLNLSIGGGANAKPGLFIVVERLAITCFYMQFLLTRKQHVANLAISARGGTAHLPFYVLDLLLDPRAAMGLVETTLTRSSP